MLYPFCWANLIIESNLYEIKTLSMIIKSIIILKHTQ
jgi:hypothetical protein